DAEGALASLTRAVSLNPSALADTHADRLRLLKALGREAEYREGLEVARKCFPAVRFPVWETPPTAPQASAAAPSAPQARAPEAPSTAPEGRPRPRLSLCMIVRDESAN